MTIFLIVLATIFLVGGMGMGDREGAQNAILASISLVLIALFLK